MNSRIFRNKSTFGFYSPQNKNSININEVEVLKDKVLKLKIELNKKNFECQELRIMYNKLDKAYKSNIILLEKLLKEANNNIINTNFSYGKEIEEKKEKEKDKTKENNNNKLEDINKNKNTNNCNSPKNKSRSVETNKSNKSYKSLDFNFKNNFLLFANKNHLTMKLQQEISELKKEANEKDKKINNLKNNANILKYKELDKKYAKMYTELMGTRENNEKLELYCLNINSKINNYKEKIKKLNSKKILIEDENYALKQKIDKIENNNNNQGNNKKNSENEKDKYQKKDSLVKNEEDIEKLKEKINMLEKENQELKEKLKNKENDLLLENKNE